MSRTATASLAAPLAPDAATAVAELQARVDSLLAGRGPLRVLEAGCGPRMHLTFPPDTYVVGVDEDDVALARNEVISEAIVADLGAYRPEPASFDAIVCWYVFEHVDRPDQILETFAGAVKPGGLVVLAVPNLRSPKSLITKVTPHSFHVWFRRHIIGKKLAGTPGHGPYPTTLRRAIAPKVMIKNAARLGLEVVHVGWYEDDKQVTARRKAHVTGPAWSFVRGAVKVTSLGTLDAAKSEFLVAFRRVGGSTPAQRAAGGVTTSATAE